MTTWSRELVVARIREWNDRFGRPPRANEWNRGMARRRGYQDALDVLDLDPGYWPHPHTVARLFASWSAAIIAADLWTGRPGDARERLEATS